MDIRILTYFLAVAREENITRAADLLHITQPTLSRQLMQLEEEVGAKLFHRNNHSVQLTDEGWLFQRRAIEMVNLAEKAKNEINQDSRELSGIISLGCLELLSVREVAQLMNAFQIRHPRVKFELYGGNNEDIREKLEQGTLDFALFLEPVNVSNYESIRMKTKEQWGVLIHKAARLASRAVIRPGDLVGTPVATIRINTPPQLELAAWSGDFAREMDWCLNYNVLHNAVIAARERKGAVICLKRDCTYDDMKFLPLDPALEPGSVLAWKENQTCSKTVKAFISFLKQNLNE